MVSGRVGISPQLIPAIDCPVQSDGTTRGSWVIGQTQYPPPRTQLVVLTLNIELVGVQLEKEALRG